MTCRCRLGTRLSFMVVGRMGNPLSVPKQNLTLNLAESAHKHVLYSQCNIFRFLKSLYYELLKTTNTVLKYVTFI